MSAAAQLFTTVVLRPRRAAQIVLQVSRAMAALAGGQIVFEIVVIRSDRGERFDYRKAERCAAEVGVNDYTGTVDYRLNFRGRNASMAARTRFITSLKFGIFFSARSNPVRSNNVNDNPARQSQSPISQTTFSTEGIFRSESVTWLYSYYSY